MSRWVVVYTNPRQERRVERDLKDRLGLTVYVPRLTRMVVTRNRVIEERQPLFPRYAFLCLTDGRTAGETAGTHGMVGVLRNPLGEPLCVSERVVSDLQFAEAAGMFDMRPRSFTFQPGQHVKAVSGPLADRMGRILAAKPGARVRMLIEGLGGQIAVEVDPAHLRPVA